MTMESKSRPNRKKIRLVRIYRNLKTTASLRKIQRRSKRLLLLKRQILPRK